MTWRIRRVCAPLVAACGVLLAACGTSLTGADTQAKKIARGQQQLARYHCGTCHVIPGVASSQGRSAASLRDYGRRSYIAGRVANEPAALARWIAEPDVIVPGTLMPTMGVRPADAQDMAAYLGQLR